MSGQTASVTVWLEKLKEGNSEALQPIWGRYYKRLVKHVEASLCDKRFARVADAEDAVTDAFHSFCMAAAAGRFPRVQDRFDLWHLLLMISERKAMKNVRRERRLVRGGGRVYGSSDRAASGRMADGLLDLEPDPGSDPGFLLAVEDSYRELAASLDPTSRKVLDLKLQGFDPAEIAQMVTRTERLVYYKLDKIRDCLEALDND